MRTLMAEKGWYGRPDKTAKDKTYINWRLNTIYQTNILTAYSAGETMTLRYNDPFWLAGTPPNGWGCQCYRNQLTESQAKTHGGIGTTPANNIIDANIPAEWRYDPGREMLAPTSPATPL